MTFSNSTTRLICPLTSTDAQAMRQEMFHAWQAGADCVECRLDYLNPPPAAQELRTLLLKPPVETIVTCRTTDQGGHYHGSEKTRLQTLHDIAMMSPSGIDIENTVSKENWPAGTIILSHHDFKTVPADLDMIVQSLESSPAAINKIVFMARGPEDSWLALEIIRRCKKPTIALAMGEAGLPSRILARKFGAFGTFGALKIGRESAPGQPTIEQFKNLYRWDCIRPATEVYGVIGCPVSHSMSPAIHNAALKAVGKDAVYVPLRVEPGADNFKRFMDATLRRPWLDLRGLSVTLPHKENALAYVGKDNCDELAVRIGAINTITISPQGKLRGDNTDYAAAIDALCCAMLIRPSDLRGKKVAVLGAGGVARAIVAALTGCGADVTVCNRTLLRSQQLADDFGCRGANLSDAKNTDAEILINCTPIGMHPHVDSMPIDRIGPSVKVVFDTIYNPIETLLLRHAKAQGCQIVTGVDMFVSQALAQFEIWMSKPAPRDAMRRVVIQQLAKNL